MGFRRMLCHGELHQTRLMRIRIGYGETRDHEKIKIFEENRIAHILLFLSIIIDMIYDPAE